MTQVVKVKKVFKSDKSKDGKEFKDKNGKPFWKVAIQTDRHGNDWYSCLAFKADDRVMNLSEGDEITIITEENNGFKNFKIPSKLDLLEARVELLEKMFKPTDVPTSLKDLTITTDDIPF